MIRYNQEYFGYVAAFDSGDIHLYESSASGLLASNASVESLRPHLLTDLNVAPSFYLQTPLYAWIELTRKCNLECPHCYISAGPARQNELYASEFMTLIDELAEMGVWAVTLTGGEPTLKEGFVDIVRHAHSKQMLVGIATNGMFLSRRLLDRLPRENVIVSVSLDNLHIMKGEESDFRVAQRGILLAREMGFLTNIMTNTNKCNAKKLEPLIHWARANGVSVRSVPFSPIGRGGLHREYENTSEDVDEAARFWLKEMEWERKYHDQSGLCVGVVFDYCETLGYLTQRCSSGRSLCYIASDGTIYPCTMCAGENLFSPGNARGGGFADAWRKEWPIRDISWGNWSETCRGCVLNNDSFHCSSRCPALSHARHRELHKCGASDFQKLSTVVRTAMLEQSPLSDNQFPIDQIVKISSRRTDN